jgi:hypothetical protein
MEKIYIGFSRNNNSVLSKTIRLIEGSEYSHVYIRKESKYGEYIYQASGLQVNFMNIDIFKAHNTIVEEYEFELPDEKKEKLIAFFVKYCGTSYGTKSLFKMLAVLACQRVGVKLHLKGDGTETFVCSELGAFFCEEILGIDIPEDIDFVTPKSLNPFVKAHGKRVV